MNRRALAGTLVLAVAISAGMVLARGGVAAAKGGGARHAKAVTMAPDDLKWEAMPGVEGVQVAMLWGNMSKGGYGAFVKLPPNQVHPLHTHSASLKVVVLSGEFKYGPAGGPEKSYGAGSYLMVPAGLRHTSASGDGELLMFQESTGAWDLKPVGAAAAAK